MTSTYRSLPSVDRVLNDGRVLALITEFSADAVAASVKVSRADVLASYVRLRAQRVLVLEDDGTSIRMAPPFSGVPTQHVA